jgi:hypothetical protein
MGYVRLNVSFDDQKVTGEKAYIYFLVEEACLQVLVDGFVSDCAEQCHVWHSCLFLLPEPFTPVGLIRYQHDCLWQEVCVPFGFWQTLLHLSQLMQDPQAPPSCLLSWMVPVRDKYEQDAGYCDGRIASISRRKKLDDSP